MSASCTTTVSSCGNYLVSRICIPNVYQGDNANIPLTLLDKAGNPLDLNTLNEIEVLIYGLDKDYSLQYTWPDTTGDETIDIIQTGTGTSMTDKGVISLYLPPEFTTNLVSGDLFATIRIKRDTAVTGREEIITFGCVIIGNIKYTELNFQ